MGKPVERDMSRQRHRGLSLPCGGVWVYLSTKGMMGSMGSWAASSFTPWAGQG